jgi:hypothetical protein
MPIKVHFEPGDPQKWNTSSRVTPVMDAEGRRPSKALYGRATSRKKVRSSHFIATTT